MINVTKVELPSLSSYKKYLDKIWEMAWVTNNGACVKKLKTELEEYLKIKNLVLVTNGTLAIQLPLKVLGLRGEVITTPFTFVATTNAVLWEGSTPIFADIDSKTFNINPEDVEKKITDKTVAILAVHVYGNPGSLEALAKIAKKHEIKLIYDAAHAFGVEYKNKPILSFGDISTLSFHATKVFNTIEGGAIVCKRKRDAEKMESIRNFGIIEYQDEIESPGINAKMNEFCAAMGLCNLKSIDSKINNRRQLYELYQEKLGSKQDVTFQKITASKYNYSYMPVLFKDNKQRDNIAKELTSRKIAPRKYFFPLTYNYKFWKNQRGTIPNCPTAENISSRVLCLPIYSTLKKTSVKTICSIISEHCN